MDPDRLDKEQQSDQQIQAVGFDFGGMSDGIIRCGEDGDGKQRAASIEQASGERDKKQYCSDPSEIRDQAQGELGLAEQLRYGKIDTHESHGNDLSVFERAEHIREGVIKKIDCDKGLIPPHGKDKEITQSTPCEIETDKNDDPPGQGPASAGLRGDGSHRGGGHGGIVYRWCIDRREWLDMDLSGGGLVRYDGWL